jgi:ABC-type multidrug transport system fused ATPase/permease subunit
MLKIFYIFNKYQKIQFLIIGILITILAFIEIVTFYFFHQAINFFLNVKELENNYLSLKVSNFSITNFLLLIIFFFIFRFLLSLFVSYRKSKFIKNVYDILSKKICSIYLNQEFSFFIKKKSSDLISNMINEVDFFSYRVVDMMLVLLTEIVVVSAILSFLLFNFFQETLLLISVFFVFLFILYRYVRNKFKKLGDIKSKIDANRISDLQNAFYIIQNIKIDHLEDYFIKKFDTNSQIGSKNYSYLQFVSESVRPALEFVVLFIVLLILFIFFIYFSMDKQSLIAMMSLMVVSIFRILPSCSKIANSMNMIKFYYYTVDKIEEEIAKESSSATYKKSNVKKFFLKDSVVFENISFSYSSKDKQVLSNINFTLKKNEVIGISGVSGSGKSTLLNILSCLLKPTKGKILVDGYPIDENCHSFQLSLGYVPQKIYLTEESLIKNIIFGIEEEFYNYELFDEVIKKSNLSKVLSGLPEGKDTALGERGNRLSGGQQQRVGIARALYKQPDILILDEATSALDEDSENAILKTISTFKNNLTIIIVSHKESVLNYCEKIYRLEKSGLFQIK